MNILDTAIAPTVLATAKEAVSQALFRNPTATLVVAGILIGGGAVALAYSTGPQAIRFVRNSARGAVAWVGSKMVRTAAPQSDGPIIDGVAEPAPV